MDKVIDAVDVRAAQMIVALECPAGDASKIERGHCAWCNAYWLIEDMWNLLEPQPPRGDDADLPTAADVRGILKANGNG